MTLRKAITALSCLLGILCGTLTTTEAQDLAAFEKRLTQFTLDNGMTFMVLERHAAPVVTLLTWAGRAAGDAGGG